MDEKNRISTNYILPMIIYSGVVLLIAVLFAITSPFAHFMGPIFIIVGGVLLLFFVPVVILATLFIEEKYQKKSTAIAIIILSSFTASVITLIFAAICLHRLRGIQSTAKKFLRSNEERLVKIDGKNRINTVFTRVMLIFSIFAISIVTITPMVSFLLMIFEVISYTTCLALSITSAVLLLFLVPIIVLATLFIEEKYQKKSTAIAIIILSSFTASVITLIFAAIGLTKLKKQSKQTQGENYE